MTHRTGRSLAALAAAGLTIALTAGTSSADPIAPAAPVANSITITSTGDNYLLHGGIRPGTATVRWVNADDEMHMMAFARLKPGVTLDKIRAALAQGEENAYPLLADGPDMAYGGPGMVTAGQGETVTMTHLRAGAYVLVCFMMEPDGTPHWAEGMVRILQVRGAAETEAPATAGTITVDDDGINLPAGFTGHGTYAVVDTGTAPHSFSLARLDQGTSLLDFADSVGMASGMGTQPSGGALVSGIDSLNPGQTAYVTLDLAAGHYGYLSPWDMEGPALPPQSGEVTIP
ncbi:hypothetical protein GCM10011492_14080 [Flexivirga endophytica]|uniref:Copper chaperone PCu(A)C n=1 Tax=Flexivirga endophytica TaxID=1849103 RepID=A0A916T0Q5_9MICO|nr:hypothetical protein [Flexivirga endophytica]GGB25231.1 hypothetical protein GCM10011492_14080 [Flexivirga endophytica]GHB53805.1 hypothetical protein GCM10008112_23400 [Flexivirga endophytica]